MHLSKLCLKHFSPEEDSNRDESCLTQQDLEILKDSERFSLPIDMTQPRNRTLYRLGVERLIGAAKIRHGRKRRFFRHFSRMCAFALYLCAECCRLFPEKQPGTFVLESFFLTYLLAHPLRSLLPGSYFVRKAEVDP